MPWGTGESGTGEWGVRKGPWGMAAPSHPRGSRVATVVPWAGAPCGDRWHRALPQENGGPGGSQGLRRREGVANG